MNDDLVAVTPERRYVLPHPALRRAISHYTVFTPKGVEQGPDVLHLVPDASGCIVCEIDAVQVFPTYWGPTSRMVTVPSGAAKSLRYIFIEFRPGGAHGILRLPQAGMADAVFSLQTVDASLARALERVVSTHCGFGAPGSVDGLVRDLNTVFLSRSRPGGRSPLVDHILHTVFESRGRSRARSLAAELGYSERHINRVMAERLGLTLKSLSRIVRINHACCAMRGPAVSLTSIAHGLDYHDQAHFIHDFQAMCGVPPGRFRKNMSGFYNEELKLAGTMPCT